MLKKRDRNFISSADIFLDEFDKTNALSLSQKAESKKYQLIGKLRDLVFRKKTGAKPQA
jgi:hypothetical protein